MSSNPRWWQLLPATRRGWSAVARALYAEDASPFHRHPRGYLRPPDVTTATTLLAELAASGERWHPRGAGSSLAGAALTEAWVLDLRDLDHIEATVPAAARVRVGAGLRHRELDRWLAARGRRFVPDPSSGAWCTLGGMAGTNAGGPRSLRWGSMRSHVERLWVVDARGEQVELRRGAPPEDPFWRGALALAPGEMPPPPPPGPAKRSFGWVFEVVETSTGRWLDPVALLVGSEGRLATILELELKTIPSEPEPWLLRLEVPQGHLGEVAAELREAGAVTIEWVDATTAAAAGQGDRDTILASFAHEPSTVLRHRLARGGAAVELLREPRAIMAAQAARKAALGRVQIRRDRLRALTWIEDPVLPLEQVDGFLAGVRSLCGAFGLSLAAYGHLGDGNLHLRPFVDPDRPDLSGLLLRLYGEVYALVAAHGGLPSGEHGVGLLRAPLLASWWPEGWAWMQRLKARLDPDGRLEPLPTPDLEEVLARLRPRPSPPASLERRHFTTALDCHGCGACDRYCPAAGRADAGEPGTARSKARLVRAWAEGTLSLAELRSPEARRVFAWCVDCDACLIDCLSALPIPRLAEAMKALVGPPSLRERLLVRPQRLVPVLRLSRPLLASPVRRPLLALGGLDPGRRPLPVGPLPAPPVPPARPRGRIALFVGCMGARQRPAALVALERLLTALGWRVERVGDGLCCGAPALQNGLPELVARGPDVDRFVAAMRERRQPLVALEATCAHTLRRWREFSRPEVAAAVTSLWELLAAHPWEEGVARRERIGYHAPCHARIEGEDERILTLLGRLPGREVERLLDHCCGMAGSWGMKATWSAAARRIGADLPERVAAYDRLATDCVTCTQQVWDLTGRLPVHPVELLWEAWPGADQPP